MSIRREMLQVARVAPRVLGDSAVLVRDFLLGQLSAAGGFCDRAGREDLYYTVFGLDGLLALRAELPLARVEGFLRAQGGGAGLDFVHLCCLARCWGCLADAGGGSLQPGHRLELIQRIRAHRSADGGFSPGLSAGSGTAYASFLALGALQDLGSAVPEPAAVAGALRRLATPDGAWGNEPRLPVGATNATAAVVTVLRQVGESVPPGVAGWLLAQGHAQGGFLAVPGAPMPDLLSTATALHALAGLQADLGPIRDRCLDFVDTLWTNQGGFHGHWGDDALDVEYTYYGLLALGHLGL
ncbi:MAG: hypothetical protein RJA22_1448 [Verrucomicrobiota bacterium]